MSRKKKQNGPKVLLFDVETAPILANVWGLFQNDVSLNQIEMDWHLLSVAAKWHGEKKVYYIDQRNAKDIEDDTKILKMIWKLLDEADVVVGHNSDRFDIKKVNARFILNGMQPPSSFKSIDTLKIAKKKFKFTSNRLAYLTDKLCNKYKKSKHKKFAGFELWKECMAGNLQAWKEMEHYNKLDVLSLEELYETLLPWDNSLNRNLYRDDLEFICSCGSTNLMKNGHHYTPSGKYQRYKCKDCGAEVRGKVNQLSKEKKKSLKTKV